MVVCFWMKEFDPEVLQSGDGSNFCVGLANFRKIAHECLSEFFGRLGPAKN